MYKVKNVIIQICFVVFILLILAILGNNLYINLLRVGLGFNFDWLFNPSGFALAEHALPYSPSDNYLWALFMGWLNSLKVIFSSLIISTSIGFCIGITRISRNIFLRIISSTYVTIIRQTPLLLQLMFWYFVGFLSIKNDFSFPVKGILNLSNQGMVILGFNFTAEFSAMLLGLSLFTAAYISEVVRGGINSVPRGQWEAFRSLGLSESIGLFRVVLPQALPVMIPGLTGQYLNLAKNSTLAIAVGYSDIYAIGDTIITQTGRAIEGFILLLVSFLLLNLLITNTMEFLNTFFLVKKKNIVNLD